MSKNWQETDYLQIIINVVVVEIKLVLIEKIVKQLFNSDEV